MQMTGGDSEASFLTVKKAPKAVIAALMLDVVDARGGNETSTDPRLGGMACSGSSRALSWAFELNPQPLNQHTGMRQLHSAVEERHWGVQPVAQQDFFQEPRFAAAARAKEEQHVVWCLLQLGKQVGLLCLSATEGPVIDNLRQHGGCLST